MAKLVILQGPNVGKDYSLSPGGSVIGRQPDSAIYLDSLSVSRQHARVVLEGGDFFIEDAGSANGTFVNGDRIRGRVPLSEHDTLQVGPYLFGLRVESVQRAPEPPEPIISAQVSVMSSNYTIFAQNPAHKLQVVLEIAQHLSRTLELETLLGRLLDHLLRLFPQADRGMVLLRDKEERLSVRAARGQEGETEYPYSRTIVNRALEEGIGFLSEDLGRDQRVMQAQTVMALKLHSVLCVPLVCQERRLGVIQLDCSRAQASFRSDDLELLTAISLHVAVVLENAALHAERLREERFRQELAMAREIQQGFLPTDFHVGATHGYELFARIHPAREVSGDLYDFFPLGDGRLAFFVGDVSGKGMPAALFMIAVRTLCRHLAPVCKSPAEMLAKLNTALAADNPSSMFVTIIYGIYDARNGGIVLSSGGHPWPLRRRADGQVEVLSVTNGRLIGYPGDDLGLMDTWFHLDRGETLILYTDGFTEAFAPDRQMFEVERLCEVLGGPRALLPLEECATQARMAIEKYTGTPEQQDDLTLFFLHRMMADDKSDGPRSAVSKTQVG